MTAANQKQRGFMRFIGGVERVGNKLPHPFMLFLGLIAIVIVASVICEWLGVSASYTKIVAGKGSQNIVVKAQSLLSRESIRFLFENFQHIFFDFSPLRAVVPLLMAIGVCEQSGLMEVLIKKTILNAPEWAISAVVAFVALNANLASDAGILAAAAVAASVYKSMGKNPWIGIAIAAATGQAGFGANLLIASQDLVVNGITDAVTKELGINAPTHILMNWYFLASAVVVLTIVSCFVTKFFTVPHLVSEGLPVDIPVEDMREKATPLQMAGLKKAGLGLLFWIILIVALAFPQNGILRADNGALLPKSPLLSSVIFIIFVGFFIPGWIYGRVTGSIKRSKDIPVMMLNALKQNGMLMVIALSSSIFIKTFNMSNLPTIIGFKGAELIRSINLAGYPTLVLIIIVTMFFNLFIASANAKWLMLAPIYIPMFTAIGFSPALITAAYRAGDSSTNPIAPLSSTVIVVMSFFEQYNQDKSKEVGLGTVISYSLPYSMFFFLAFCAMIAAFYFFDLPLGPGVGAFLK